MGMPTPEERQSALIKGLIILAIVSVICTGFLGWILFYVLDDDHSRHEQSSVAPQAR